MAGSHHACMAEVNLLLKLGLRQEKSGMRLHCGFYDPGSHPYGDHKSRTHNQITIAKRSADNHACLSSYAP